MPPPLEPQQREGVRQKSHGRPFSTTTKRLGAGNIVGDIRPAFFLFLSSAPLAVAVRRPAFSLAPVVKITLSRYKIKVICRYTLCARES